MKSLREIVVRAPSKKYIVYYGDGVLRRGARLIAEVGGDGRTFVVSSRNVGRHLSAKTMRALTSRSNSSPIIFDDREAAKDIETVEQICRDLARACADRHSTIVAIGGGVVGDVAGFAAASFLRGVRLIHVPTTLVAQVDSAIGGKTGVNLPEGKNLIGAFYQPDAVIADPSLLRTLPDREYRSGIYEVIKYGVVGDAALFRYCEANLEDICQRDAKSLDFVIPRCVAAKARVTVADERESGLRETLNFGHTIGHALESVTRYRVFRHGEAVGWGMIAAALLGLAMPQLSPQDAARIIRLVRRVGPLPVLPKISATKLLAAMRTDKKSRGGKLRFVLPLKIGRVKTGVRVPDEVVALVWDQLSRLERRRQ
jgi:3-dehydroquinate synthase